MIPMFKNNKFSTMCFAITGVTGLLGRNLFFEIIKQNISSLDDIFFILLCRSNELSEPLTRISEMLSSDGMYYLGLDDSDFQVVKHKVLKNIKIIHFDLANEKLIPIATDLDYIQKSNIDQFFHISAATDFRSTPEIESYLYKVNYIGTRNLFNLIEKASINSFFYVSSAYACGIADGRINSNYLDLNGNFRNPYERTKALTERFIAEYFSEHRGKYTIFRPSTLCGRLIEPPFGATCKFDVFYKWVAFLYYQKLKSGTDSEGYSKVPIRFYCNQNAGLNIIPADLAAKLMLGLISKGESRTSFHICSNSETPHCTYASLTLDFLKIIACELVDKMPENMNRIEALYYRTVGKVFTPYVTSKPMDFDMLFESEVMQELGLNFVDINYQNFQFLLSFAQTRGYGI